MPKKKKVKEEEVFHVEVITKARVSEEGDSWEYFVKWAGYGSDADSWEPAENVQQCNRLLASFWKHVGTDDGDYAVGYKVEANESWINKEKRYFAETFIKPSKRGSDKAKKERQQSKLSISESSVIESQSSDEGPPVKTPIKKIHKARVINSESESESESDGTRKEVPPRSKVIAPPAKEQPKVPIQVKRQETSASSSSLPVAPPKVPALRTHQDQRANPLVKAIDIPSKSVEAGSLLSTKQRIAAGIPPPPTGPKPLPPPPKKSLSSLSFKKNKPPVPPVSVTKDTAMPSTSVPTPTSPVAQPPSIFNDADVIASPQPMDVDQPFNFFDSTPDDIGPLNKSPEIPTVALPPKPQSEISAEEFLRTVHIPALNAPLGVDITADKHPIELSKTTTVSKIPKKWKWSGDLFISTSDGKAESLCAITIVDPGGISNSAHLNLLLSKLDSLQISKLYPIMDLSPLLRACGKPQYFGRLETNEPSEEVIIEGLEHHLKNEGLAAVIPLLHDGAEAAALVVFPTAQQGLTKVLQVPEHLLSRTSLLVVLLPYLVSTMGAGHRTIEVGQQSLYNLEDMSSDPSQETVLHQAMSLLCFPKALLDFLSNPSASRSYAIWPLPDQLSSGLDAILLQCILKSTKAILAKVEEDVRVIFISNRHLGMLHTMQSLVTKRVNSPEVQFWTYGHSADMAERWKVQEIYPLGGIVTFTASALVEDLVGCHQFISQIVEHPLWDCYLIPEVLATCHLLCNDGNTSPSIQPLMDPILDFINLGLISVMRMPEKGQSNQLAWLSQVFHSPAVSGHKQLEFHLEVLKRQTSGMTTEQLITFTNNEIMKDLSRAQIQPAFMEYYRRFVVIRATSEDAIPFDKDGLEWTSLAQFSFKDDYFQV